MSKLKTYISKSGVLSLMSAMAIMIVAKTANFACLWTVHQPEQPEAAKRFRKF